MEKISDIISRSDVLDACAAVNSRNVTTVADHLMIATERLEPYRLSTKMVYNAILNQVKVYVRNVLKSLTITDLEYGDGIGMPVDCDVQEWLLGPVDQLFAEFPALKDRSHMVPSISEYRTAIELMDRPQWRSEVEAALGFHIEDVVRVRDAYVAAGSTPTPPKTKPVEEKDEQSDAA